MGSKVTVLTTVYNGMPYLREAIESTLNQTYAEFEYLIIDDGSTDDSVKCIKSYNDSRIRFVQNEKNLGTSDTINKGLSLIKTPYVVRLDQDDVSLPNRIHEQIEYLDNHPEISIVCSWEHIIDSDGKIIRNCRASINNYGDFLGPILLGLCPIWHPSITFRKDDMVMVGGFDTSFTRAEDFEVTAKYALERLHAAIVPKFHLLQRKHFNSQSALYDDRQASVARRVHVKVLNFFNANSFTDELGYFLRLEKELTGKKMTKEYLQTISYELENLLSSIEVKQKLTPVELKSLKKIIYKRAGLGILFLKNFSFLPAPLFKLFFYTLSPLQIPSVRGLVSKIYYKIMRIPYLIKSVKN